MIDHKELMRQGSELIAANLAECCREELEWQNTALLCNGKMREAGAIYSQVDASHALSIVQSEVARQAMQVVAAAPQVVADERQERVFLAELLARIHRDGGHRQNDVGTEQAFREADTIVANWFATAPVQAQEPVLMTKQQVVDTMIDNNLLTDNGRMALLNGDSITSNLEFFTQVINFAALSTVRAPVQPVAVPDGLTSEEIVKAAYEKFGIVADDMEIIEFINFVRAAAPAAQGDAKDAHCYECDDGLVYADGDTEPCRSCEQGKLLALEAMAKEIYETWQSHPEFVAWQHGGNSRMQDRARDMARAAIAAKAAS